MTVAVARRWEERVLRAAHPIAFPLLSMPSLEGVDLHVAVLALDPVTGLARDASTFVTMLLRDLDVCQ